MRLRILLLALLVSMAGGLAQEAKWNAYETPDRSFGISAPVPLEYRPPNTVRNKTIDGWKTPGKMPVFGCIRYKFKPEDPEFADFFNLPLDKREGLLLLLLQQNSLVKVPGFQETSRALKKEGDQPSLAIFGTLTHGAESVPCAAKYVIDRKTSSWVLVECADPMDRSKRFLDSLKL